MKKKVIINGDDFELIQELRDVFKKANYMVFCENDSEKVQEKINEIKPDIAVLVFNTQVNFGICRSIKADKKIADTALVVISSSNDNEDKHDVIEGFRLGVEDFVLRPVDPDIFLAKVKAIMRRLAFRNKPDDVLKYENLEINMTSHAVFIDKKKVELTPKEFALLYYLVSNSGKVMSREYLMEQVWEQEYLGDSRTVNKHIETLRRKTGNFAKNIETVQGTGYRFAG